MQFRLVLVTAIALSALATGSAPAADKSVTAGPLGLAINNSARVRLATAAPIAYRNRPVANGRRNLSLQLAQPMLCADFATPPGAASNPVSLTFVDPNLDSFGPLYGGITSFTYVTNGAAAGLFKVNSSTNLACCVMSPAPNASCVQGTIGGPAAEALFSYGFEGTASAQTASAKAAVQPDLTVTVSGPNSGTPGFNFDYSITVANIGDTQVNGVHVRDWFPKLAGGFPAPLAPGNWTCAGSAGATCGTPSGNGNIALTSVSLPGHSSVTFNVSRQLNPASLLGAQFSVSAAAFAPPAAGETALGNNQGSLSATVQQASFSINDVTQVEGTGSNSTFRFTITRSNTSGAASVVVNTANGSATAGSDYTAISNQTINFTAGGSATAFVDVTVTGDAVLEGNETFSVVLSNPTGAGITDGTGAGTINNDDAASIAIGSRTLVEGNSGNTAFQFPVTLTGAVQGSFTVPVSSSNGSASAGSDYTAIPGGTLLTFSGTQGEVVNATVQVTGDTVLEPDETFTVTIGAPSNTAVTIAPGGGTGTGTITNDDAASLAIGNRTLAEGNSGNTAFQFTVTLTGAVQGAFTVPVSSSNGTATATSDYTAINTVLNFAGTAGETQTATVQVTGDNMLEANETFNVVLGAPSNAQVTVTTNTGIGTITNDDAASIAIESRTLAEGNSSTTAFEFIVRLTGSVQDGFTVPVSSRNSSATQPSDYTAISGVLLTFAGTANETQTATVQVNGDTMLEIDETFFVDLGIPSNPAVTRSVAVADGTILNDDVATLQISDAVPAPIIEGNSGTSPGVFTVTLVGSVQSGFEVAFQTVDGTATVANLDYVANAGTLTFNGGGTVNETKTVTVLVNGDTTVELVENFKVTISPPGKGITMGNAEGTATISNDDPPPSGADKRR